MVGRSAFRDRRARESLRYSRTRETHVRCPANKTRRRDYEDIVAAFARLFTASALHPNVVTGGGPASGLFVFCAHYSANT